MPAHAQKTQTLAGLSDWQPVLVPEASSRARRCYLRKFFWPPKEAQLHFPRREDGFKPPAAAHCQGSLFGECLFL